jgi:hypothetical protein
VRVLIYGPRYTASWIPEGDLFLINSGGDYETVYYGFIEGGGIVVTAQFQANGQTGSLADRDKLALVALKNGEFVLVWNGLGLNSTAYGVFG